MSACLFVCLTVCQPACLPVSLPGCPHACQTVRLPVCLGVPKALLCESTQQTHACRSPNVHVLSTMMDVPSVPKE